MLRIELKLDSEVYYAGDEISLDISLIREFQLKHIQLLDGSVQLLGRSMFVSDFYSFPRVQELFGEMAKVKEECKIISTDKGETFTFPFYITKPSLLTFPDDVKSDNFNWKGKLPRNISSSFIGLFCSFQHLARVKIIWKCAGTGQIGVTQSEIVFKVHSNVNSPVVLGVLRDAKIPERDLDEIFPDDFIIKGDSKKLLEEIINYKKLYEGSVEVEEEENVEDIFRSIAEVDCGYNRSISVEIVGSNMNIGKINLRKTFIHPGTQIFMTFDLNLISRVELIKITLECIETYPVELLRVPDEQRIWRDTVKEMKIAPGCQDRLEIVFPISPELIPTVSCELFSLQWELLLNFKVNENDFDLKIPLNFIPLKFELNKLR